VNKSLVVIGLLTTGFAAKANGQFTVLNVGQPIFDVDGTTKLAKEKGRFEVIFGTMIVSFPGDGSGTPFAADGLISSGADTYCIPGANVGDTPTVTIAAWDVTTGSSFFEAIHKRATTFTLDPLGGGATPPGGISNFRSFKLTIALDVPEPSTYALAALGLSGLVLVSRRMR
jgi:hypothetical protein